MVRQTQPGENPGGKINIQVKDFGGWFCVYPESRQMADEFEGDLSLVLGKTLHSWLQQHPHIRVQFAIPMTKNGRTYEIYAWYEQAPLPSAAASGLNLADHQLTESDFADFRKTLDRLGAALEAVNETWRSPTGVLYHRLSGCRVLVGDGSVEKVEEACVAHGFRVVERESSGA